MPKSTVRRPLRPEFVFGNDETVKEIIRSHVFPLTVILSPEGRIIRDYSTIPLFIIDYIRRNVSEIGELKYKVKQIHSASPNGVYMVRYKPEQSVFQGAVMGMGFWYPISNMPEVGLVYYYTRVDALHEIETVHFPAFRIERPDCCMDDFEVVAFDHELERSLYDEGKWAVIWEDRPVKVCPKCKTANPLYPTSRWFYCSGCQTSWEGVYCPITGSPGYCKADCVCHEILLTEEVQSVEKNKNIASVG